VERLRFVRQASASGWAWLVALTGHFGALVIVLAFLGASLTWTLRLRHWWLGPLIFLGVLFVLFAEGAFRLWSEVSEELRQAQGELDEREKKEIVLENLARRLILGRHHKPMALWYYKEQDPDEYEAELETARTQAQEWARTTYRYIQEKVGWDEAAAFESDYGLPSQYDGPSSYLATEEEIANFVARRCLRLEQIMIRLRRGDAL
jgi:hypothetical protein